MRYLRALWQAQLLLGMLIARPAAGESLYRKPRKFSAADRRNVTFSLWKAKSREQRLRPLPSSSGDNIDRSGASSDGEEAGSVGVTTQPTSTRGRAAAVSAAEVTSLHATRAKAQAHSARLRVATASNRTGHQV